jgi:Rad3-related DNA helicase
LDGLSEEQIVKAFAKEYPQHKNPKARVKRHLNHLRDDDHVDLSIYLGKGNTSVGQQSSNSKTNVLVHLPDKADVDRAEEQLRKTSSDEVIRLNAVLDQVEINFKKAEKYLKENWRDITKHNIKIWFSKE